uniref:Sorting nexin-6-like n=1 Tax=Sinocyclocheilus grahami TaxID=75366 RepID=A0A672SBA9_SINGR
MMQEGLDDGPDFLSEEDRGVSFFSPFLIPVLSLSSYCVLCMSVVCVCGRRTCVLLLVSLWPCVCIPPAPPKPDFDASREKLQKLGEGEGSMTKEEFTKMKQELEAEYLAIFKKTVAMHEVFLCRVAAHPVLRKDLNFHVFLEYNQDLSVRGKNKKEKLEDFFKNVVKSADGVLVAGVKVSSVCSLLPMSCDFFIGHDISHLFEKLFTLDLLYRRGRALVDYENANKALDKARAKNKDVLQAETTQQVCCQKFEKISESAKQELIDFKTRRVAAFRKNLVELAELELKHAKGNLQLLHSCLGVLKGDT